MSDLNAILQAVTGIAVILNGETLAVDTPDNLKASYASGDLPRRVLLPFGSKPMEGTNGGIITFGTQPNQAQQTNTWQVTDLLLLAPSAQGKLTQWLPSLVRYASLYANAALLRVRLVDNSVQKATLTGWHFEFGMFEYPEGSGAAYYGVATTLSIQELS